MAKLRRGYNAATLLDKAIDFRAYSDTRRYRVELDYVGATMYYVLGNFDKAFDMFRWIIFRGEEYTMNHPNVWNLYTRIVARMNDRKHHKYLLRLLFKHSNVIPLIMHNGHNAFLCGSYKYALGEFKIQHFMLRNVFRTQCCPR